MTPIVAGWVVMALCWRFAARGSLRSPRCGWWVSRRGGWWTGLLSWRCLRCRSRSTRRASASGTAGESGQASRRSGALPLAAVNGLARDPRAGAAGCRGGVLRDETGASGEPGGADSGPPARGVRGGVRGAVRRGGAGGAWPGPLRGVCGVSEPVHLVAAGEASRGWRTLVALCGEVDTDGPDGGENPRYCAECVREAIRWCAGSEVSR
jgi:hypothetical protein